MPKRLDPHEGNPDHAALEATRGAVSGAIRWGTFSLLAGVVAYLSSPIFRNLTVQFKVYLWMCPTVVGSMIEADNRLRGYESMIRRRRRAAMEDARERAYVREIEELERRGRE
ncbi:hypothetical protein B9Z19DRAFT_101535 [Tuber borchii]|uniref:Uncharacterized protein n=1 Tax=Tuber borchii TaxID=42251 RepID=A0A2T6ZRT0_TUBBO|nr:hypothetical protein B9Z19DRAFT_101535 [Tuber borchii]